MQHASQRFHVCTHGFHAEKGQNERFQQILCVVRTHMQHALLRFSRCADDAFHIDDAARHVPRGEKLPLSSGSFHEVKHHVVHTVVKIAT